MKAAVYKKYGPPEVLKIKTIEKPVPKNNEILVKVYATTVNRTDCGILWGKPFIIRLFTGIYRPGVQVTGTDFAGLVEVAGKDVKSFQAGDRVWGFNDSGLASHAEYLTIAENNAVSRIPKNLNYEMAAASGEGAHYALNFLNKVELKKGDKVMVNGASGAIGSAMVQLLKYQDIQVTATCNTENTDRVKSLGADKVIDYLKADFTKDNDKYEFVFDAVGKSSFSKCKPLLKPGGFYISSELGPNNQNPFLALIGPLKGKNAKKVKFPFPVDCRKSVLFINKLLEEGKFRPLIDRTYPLEKIAEAFNYVASGQKSGNVVLTPT